MNKVRRVWPKQTLSESCQSKQVSKTSPTDRTKVLDLDDSEHVTTPHELRTFVTPTVTTSFGLRVQVTSVIPWPHLTFGPRRLWTDGDPDRSWVPVTSVGPPPRLTSNKEDVTGLWIRKHKWWLGTTKPPSHLFMVGPQTSVPREEPRRQPQVLFRDTSEGTERGFTCYIDRYDDGPWPTPQLCLLYFDKRMGEVT